MATHRTIGSRTVNAIGLGCMELSHAYGAPVSVAAGLDLLHKALDLGVNHFDTAALYGFGRNEQLLGRALKAHRDNIFLASKCGMKGVDGKRVIDGRPKAIRQDIEESLGRLQTDVLDIFYLHRWDQDVPIEDSVGALGQLVAAGKIKAIGLSEVSATRLLKAHAVHPIAAVQSEYSLWSRNVEIGVLDACKEIGAAFVAFSPLARGFLTAVDIQPDAFTDKDIRRGMPRFQQEHFTRNARLLKAYRTLAEEVGCTPAQLTLAWLLHQGPHIHVIPGTTKRNHLEDNLVAGEVVLSDQTIEALNKLINTDTVSGGRYNAATLAEIDTESFTSA